jgi:Flp pilus assembly protein TadD
VDKGIAYLRQAIDADPSFALAYDGLSYAYGVADDLFMSPADSMPKAKEASRKALELDDTLPEAHVDMAVVYFFYDYDWAAADTEFRRAIELKPDYAKAHEYYGWFLVTVGRREEGVAESRKAAQLDPLSPETNSNVGQSLYQARLYDEAIDQLRKTLDMEPSYWLAHQFLGLSYEAKGDLPKAIVELKQARKLEANVHWILAELGCAYAVSGNRNEAEQSLKELKDASKQSYVPPYDFARVYNGLGDRQQALTFLEKAYEERSMLLTNLPTDPAWDSLRSEPRFKELLRKMGL